MNAIGTAVMGILAVALTVAAGPQPDFSPIQEPELACIIMAGNRESAAQRTSPLDSISFKVGGGEVKICYGRPSARGRTITGGLLPYGELWRTGANEPTMIHTSVPLEIAGIHVEAGSYSLYTVIGETEWEIIVNASITQWGRENRYTEEVRAQEVERAVVPVGSSGIHVETFTISATEGEGGDAVVILEWERTRIRIPVSAAT